ncbi:MAG: lipid-A-disaccharide synthase [Microcystaceae cyanobacterium]
MRIFISTGEVSGDLQGAMLIEALKRKALTQGIDLEILALGGDLMEKAGAKLLNSTTAIGSIGIFEALPLIFSTWKIQQQVKRFLGQSPPDVVILIDYMGPNIAIGNYIRQSFPDVPIIYYIAPQSWVWAPNKGSTRQLVKVMDRLLAIFPEEARFFEKQGVSVSWVGHPLIDRLHDAPSKEEARQNLGIPLDKTIISLFPVSRPQELTYLLPSICQAAQQIQTKLPDVHFLIAVSLDVYKEKIAHAVQSYGLQATLLEGRTLDAIAAADLAICKSGTVNLEIALLNIPQVVIYRLNPATMWIARNIMKFSVPYLSPPNIVLNKGIVPELIQENCTSDNITQEALDLLLNDQRRGQMLQDYQAMQTLLGEVGVCDRAANEIFEFAGI